MLKTTATARAKGMVSAVYASAGTQNGTGTPEQGVSRARRTMDGCSGKSLTPKQARFVREYLIDLDATKAARRCGYSPHTAGQQGHRLLKIAEIAREVSLRQTKLFANLELTAENVLEELRRIGFSNITELYDEDGNLKRFQDLAPEHQHIIASSETLIAKASGPRFDTVQRIKLHDKMKALELRCRYFKLADEGLRLSVDDEILARLQAGRERARALSHATG